MTPLAHWCHMTLVNKTFWQDYDPKSIEFFEYPKNLLEIYDKRITEGEKRADIARSLGVTEGALKTQIGRRRNEIQRAC